MEDQILEELGNGCITAAGMCWRENNHHERQTYVRYIEKTSLLQEVVFWMGRSGIWQRFNNYRRIQVRNKQSYTMKTYRSRKPFMEYRSIVWMSSKFR